MKVMTSSINNLNYILNTIINIMEKNENVSILLRSVIKNSYKAIRVDKNILNDLYYGLNNLTYFIIDNYQKNKINNELLSLIALKNDIKLQHKLTEKHVDLYLKEVKYIIDSNTYLSNNETFLKVLECLAKIQFAYNILETKKSVREIYESVMQLVTTNNIFGKRLTDLQKQNVNYNYCDMGLTYFYYMLFYKKFPHIGYISAMKVILTNWKFQKIEYYMLTKEEIELEISSNTYNFIYL